MRKQSGLARAALLGNGMVWFGAAVFVLGLAGEHLDVVVVRPWPGVVGFALLVAIGVGLAVGGVLENRRIRARRFRLH